MRRTLSVGVVLALCLVLSAQAGAALTPTEKKLTKQVVTLQKQVKTLQKQVKDLQAITTGALAINICSAAVTADLFQGTWAAINAREGATIFTPEAAVNDTGACAAAEVTRQPTANPPTLTPLKALLSIFSSFG